MRKAAMAGAAAVALVATAFAVAPTVRSQNRSEDSPVRDRRIVRLDGRGSAIGVSIRDLDSAEASRAKLPGPAGVVIEGVDSNSPAAKAGLRDGDIVVEFDGERIRSARHFARLVQETPEGRTVKATIVREGSRQTLDVTPESTRAMDHFVLPDIADNIEREVERSLRRIPRNFAFDFNWDEGYPEVAVWPRGRLGAHLSTLTDQLAEYFGAKDGVLVSSVDGESAAARAGLKAGDVITSINGRTVDSPGDIAREVREAASEKEVEIGIIRDKKPMTLKAQLPERRLRSPRYVRPA